MNEWVSKKEQMPGRDLRQVALHFAKKLDKIKVALFDVDGVLTNGQIYWAGEELGFNRFFHVHDGYGMKILRQAGLQVGVISGGDSVGVKKRFVENLELDYVYLGDEDKTHAWEDVLSKGLDPSEIFYMGDEFFDIPLLKQAGFSATTAEAGFEVKEQVDYVAERPAGLGAARELMDIIRYAQGIVLSDLK